MAVWLLSENLLKWHVAKVLCMFNTELNRSEWSCGRIWALELVQMKLESFLHQLNDMDIATWTLNFLIGKWGKWYFLKGLWVIALRMKVVVTVFIDPGNTPLWKLKNKTLNLKSNNGSLLVNEFLKKYRLLGESEKF